MLRVFLLVGVAILAGLAVVLGLVAVRSDGMSDDVRALYVTVAILALLGAYTVAALIDRIPSGLKRAYAKLPEPKDLAQLAANLDVVAEHYLRRGSNRNANWEWRVGEDLRAAAEALRTFEPR